MDRISKQHRSWNMSRIRSSGTQPERVVQTLLRRMGLRFRVSDRSVPGTPDIVLPQPRVALFVHGCFWHRHRGCKFAYTPKSRTRFWSAKFAQNVQRDAKVRAELRRLGWGSVVVWECQVRDVLSLSSRISAELRRLSMSKGTYCKPLLPILPVSPTPSQARTWLRAVVRAIGPGFHPDTDPSDYLDRTSGTRLFSRREAARLGRGLRAAEAILAGSRCDIYETCARVQQKLLGLPSVP